MLVSGKYNAPNRAAHHRPCRGCSRGRDHSGRGRGHGDERGARDRGRSRGRYRRHGRHNEYDKRWKDKGWRTIGNSGWDSTSNSESNSASGSESATIMDSNDDNVLRSSDGDTNLVSSVLTTTTVLSTFASSTSVTGSNTKPIEKNEGQLLPESQISVDVMQTHHSKMYAAKKYAMIFISCVVVIIICICINCVIWRKGYHTGYIKGSSNDRINDDSTNDDNDDDNNEKNESVIISNIKQELNEDIEPGRDLIITPSYNDEGKR